MLNKTLNLDCIFIPKGGERDNIFNFQKSTILDDQYSFIGDGTNGQKALVCSLDK